MPRPMQHPRQAPRETACNVSCGTLLPLSTSRKHVPVTVGAQVHLGPGHEATERGRGMGPAAVLAVATNAACEPASQRASREAMLPPDGR
jgi:hypothetical protein